MSYSTPVLVPLPILHKKCNKSNAGVGEGANFLDEGGAS
jgi:hypothetical protein